VGSRCSDPPGQHRALPLSRRPDPSAVGEHVTNRITRTSGMNTCRAGCGESRTSGRRSGRRNPPAERLTGRSGPTPTHRSVPTTKRSRLAGACYGYCSSHSRFFWGLRLHLVCTPADLPITFALTRTVWYATFNGPGIRCESDATERIRGQAHWALVRGRSSWWAEFLLVGPGVGPSRALTHPPSPAPASKSPSLRPRWER